MTKIWYYLLGSGLWYYLMLGSWLLFLIPAFTMRPRGVAKFLLWLSIVGGILATLCQYPLGFLLGMVFRSVTTATTPIPFILLQCFLFFCLWGVGVGGIYLCARDRALGRVRRVMGFVSAVPIILAIGFYGKAWHHSLQTEKQLDRSRQLKTALLFDANFRSHEAYQRYFGPFTDDVSMGHYTTSHPSYTRIVLNADNELWLFYRCDTPGGKAECHFGPTRLDQDTAEVADRLGSGRRVTVMARTPQELTLDIGPRTARTGGVFSGERVVFRASAPPIRADAPDNALRYVGSYGALNRLPKSVRLIQWWVWQDDDSLYVVRVETAHLPVGRRVRCKPEVLGRGKFDAQTGAYVFDSVTPHLVVRKAGKTLIVSKAEANAPNEPLTLEATEFLRDDIFTLAPLESATTWTQWFETVLFETVLEWDVTAEGV